MKRFLKILNVILLVVTISGVYLIWWRSNLPYENGRYYDAKRGVVWHEQAILAYSMLTFFCFLFWVFTLVLIIKIKSKLIK